MLPGLMDAGRPDDPGRRRFLAALAVSVLLHGALLFGLRIGPRWGAPSPFADGRGVIEARLRTSGTAATEATASERTEPAAATATTLPATTTDPQPAAVRPREPPPLPPQAEDARHLATPASSDDNAGAAAQYGIRSGVSEADALPVLPPLATAERGLPRPGSLMSPMNFSYPSGMPMQWGKVRVRMLLDDRGAIEEMRVAASAPAGTFDDAALQVLRAGRYAPAFIGKQAVRSYLYMEVSFGPGPQGQRLWYAGSAIAPPAYAR